MARSGQSKDFFELIKSIGESKSKQEEDRIILQEVTVLKQRFSEKNNSKAFFKEALVRLIYIEMLGHDASFGYVYAIQLTASENLLQKRVGYLCSSLCLSPEHEFRFMLVNQMQRDLQSSNMLEACAALVAVCKLVTGEMIPALLPGVVALLKHEKAMVRKKACMALHRCFQIDPDSVSHLEGGFRKMISDKDPAVMASALCWMHELSKRDPELHKDMVGSYVAILKQVIEQCLPADYSYHRIPAPWIQIKLLQILAVLGRNDQRTSEPMYDVLGECMRRADTGINAGYAVIYECVKTVTTIYPNTRLLDTAAVSISRFITSESHNLKYLGVTGLASIVRDHPRYASKHQMVVLDCLEDPDETLRRKTLDLLYRMTNPVNAEVVVEKLLHFLRQGADEFLKRDLVTRITQLAERYAPNNNWYVRTLTTVFELGGDVVEEEVAHNLLRLLAEGGDDEASDADMRREACALFMDLLALPVVPEILMNVMFWTLGEYAYLLGQHLLPETAQQLCKAASSEGVSSKSRAYAVSAMLKIDAQLGALSPCCATFIDQYVSSVSVDIQQRCYEFRELSRTPALLQSALPVDASCEDLSNVSFPFLESFVEAKRAEGLPEYAPPNDEDNDSVDDEEREFASKIETLKYAAYEKPIVPTAATVASNSVGLALGREGGASARDDETPGASSRPGSSSGAVGLNLSGVKSMWGASGYAGGGGQQAGTATQPKSGEAVAQQGGGGGSSNGDGVSAELAATLASEFGLDVNDLPAGITLKDLQDDLRARAEMDKRSDGRNANPPSSTVIRNGHVQYGGAGGRANGNNGDGRNENENGDEEDEEEEEVDEELAERQQMAAALFGGVSATSSSAAGPKRSAPRRRVQTSSRATNASTAAASSGVAATNATSQRSPRADAAATGEVDLLGLDMSSTSVSSDVGVSQPATAHGGGGDMLDLMSGAGGGGGGGLTDLSELMASVTATPASTNATTLQASPMDTPTFGAMWGDHSAEGRASVANVSSGGGMRVEAWAELASEKLGIAAVEVIAATQEAIFAGKDPNTNEIVLVHSKVSENGQGVDVLVRSRDQRLTDRVVQACQVCLPGGLV